MRKALKIFLWISFIFLLGFVAYYFLVLRFERITYYGNSYDRDFGESCNVGGVEVRGEIVTYVTVNKMDDDFASSEYIYSVLDDYKNDDDIKVIVVEIDSYGGLPVAAEEIATKIKRIEKPVLVLVRESALSAGYWIASAGDRIFASKLSDIGSIGVTMSYLDSSVINERQGYTWNDLSTGQFKDAGTRQKPLTAEEKEIFKRDLEIIHEEFIRTISENRKIPMEAVRALADGSSVLGEMAIEKGLIDEIGSFYEIDEYIKKNFGIEPEYCWS
jgi:protease-4